MNFTEKMQNSDSRATFDFSGKRVAVIGMARSGLAAAQVLRTLGADVSLHDSKPPAELTQQVALAKKVGILTYLESNEAAPGSQIVITSPGVRRDAPIIADALVRKIPVWGEIEAAFRIARAPILAITGTNGKTTTTALLGEMTKRGGYRTFVGGNIAAGDLAMPLIRAALDANPGDVIVAEISSFQLEWIDRFQPKVAAILNISADHLDRQTWDEYIGSKWRLFENQSSEDTSVLRSNVPRPIPAPHLRSKVVFFDKSSRPSWLNNIKLPGEHNKENVMAALEMAKAFGISDSAARIAALEFTGVVHRLEHVATIGGVDWINNSMCTNNDAFARSLDAIEGTKVVIAGGVYKGGDMSPMIASAASASNRAVIWFGKSGEVLNRASQELGAPVSRIVMTLTEAVELAREIAQPGDTVVLNPGCASFDQFRDFEDRGDQFKKLVGKMSEKQL